MILSGMYLTGYIETKVISSECIEEKINLTYKHIT